MIGTDSISQEFKHLLDGLVQVGLRFERYIPADKEPDRVLYKLPYELGGCDLFIFADGYWCYLESDLGFWRDSKSITTPEELQDLLYGTTLGNLVFISKLNALVA